MVLLVAPALAPLPGTSSAGAGVDVEWSEVELSRIKSFGPHFSGEHAAELAAVAFKGASEFWRALQLNVYHASVRTTKHTSQLMQCEDAERGAVD
ncbi:hypothetical protein CYMTET_28739 [Cymbomonas tetramitiformis]|uniref:Uncharacterized protein n=1 Tax=Cymbomonas tetramitiformis TaxID=36881 RepID=A0AAE0FMC7_9CHLO|nr:hypothetical protein CYMTET_28739 [Cymbomonas tetramitiformis]